MTPALTPLELARLRLCAASYADTRAAAQHLEALGLTVGMTVTDAGKRYLAELEKEK